jgi:hypothetical protein
VASKGLTRLRVVDVPVVLEVIVLARKSGWRSHTTGIIAAIVERSASLIGLWADGSARSLARTHLPRRAR